MKDSIANMNIEDKNYTHNIYLVTVLYDVPQGGNIRVAAESPEKARELLQKQLGYHKNFEIAQVIDESDIRPTSFQSESAPVLQADAEEDDTNETPPSQRLH